MCGNIGNLIFKKVKKKMRKRVDGFIHETLKEKKNEQESNNCSGMGLRDKKNGKLSATEQITETNKSWFSVCFKLITGMLHLEEKRT